MEARKFSKEEYIKYDDLAKESFKKFLLENNHTIIKDTEDYYHDLVTSKDNKEFYYEVEIKKGYPFTNKESFRFSTVSFLGRKERLHNIKPFYYVIICKETNWAVICPSDIIYQEKYKEQLYIHTQTRKGSDEMFRIPRDFCRFYDLN